MKKAIALFVAALFVTVAAAQAAPGPQRDPKVDCTKVIQRLQAAAKQAQQQPAAGELPAVTPSAPAR